MQRSSRKVWLIGVALVLCLIAIVLAVIPALRSTDKGYFEIKTLVDIKNYTAALATYSNVFGMFPLGDNSAVTRALAGDNSQRLFFLNLSPQQTNNAGEFLDPRHLPYEIEVTTNSIHISRRIN